MARTYAYAVGGNITSMKFSGKGRAANANGDGSFSLSFALNSSIKMPTEIFVSSEYYYRNGFSATVEPANLFTQVYNDTSRILKLYPIPDIITRLAMGSTVTVQIIPNP